MDAPAANPGTEEAKALMCNEIRSAFGDNATLYSTLFQILGCLPMRWDCWYEPEQNWAFEFLTRAPREELDAAIRLATRSKISTERQGAARMVFSQFFMEDHGKTKSDISTWMTLLADAAYSEPLPENRRLVLARLLEYRGAMVFDVLERAAADPDQTVRRRTIQLLAKDRSPKAVRLLRRLAAGELTPRVESWGSNVSMDFSDGVTGRLDLAEMKEQHFSDTDHQAAAAAIKNGP